MEIEDLKNAWEKDNPETTPEISLEKQKEIHLPLEKIRKNMRMEFWSTIVVLVSLLLFFEITTFESLRLKVYCITFIGAMILVTHFYFYKFFLLYKNLGSIDLNIQENLKDLIFQFKLNEQYYLSYYIAFVPFIIAEVLIIFEFLPNFNKLDSMVFIATFLGACFFALLFLYSFGKWWFKIFYGKYINKIFMLIENLKQ